MSTITPTVPARRPRRRPVDTEITALHLGSVGGIRDAIDLFARRMLEAAAIGHDRDQRTHAATVQALNALLLDMLNTHCPVCQGKGTFDRTTCPNIAAHRS
ncbi:MULTISPECIES: hypothetical protein [Streptomyces]|uniref:hypothetical protein n=1 Tax=Streptomyces TaxID=1883 RepID=UPI0004CC9082|nr:MULTISPECIES: hypothetical protein [Streptomyces]KOT47133.1 hypothetical protein ADK43_40365 [Streptomyces rimosus subsp. rimosus]